MLVVAVVAGIVAFREMTATVPLPEAESLMDAATVGFAELRLEPDDPWILGIFERDGSFPVPNDEVEKVLPADLVWTAHRAGEGPETHLVSLSVSPRGKIFGLAIDFTLWKMGRSAQPHFSRVEHAGEGITSFTGPFLPGSIFATGNRVVWASDLPTARLGVDLLAAPAEARAAASPPVLALLPRRAGALVAGAIANENGAVARSLALVPGGLLKLPEQGGSALAGLAFSFDTISRSEGEGEVTLHFAPGTPQPVMEAVATDLAAQISGLAVKGLTLSATARYEDAKAVLLVRATGLESLYDQLAAWFVKGVRTLEEISEEAEPAPSGS